MIDESEFYYRITLTFYKEKTFFTSNTSIHFVFNLRNSF